MKILQFFYLLVIHLCCRFPEILLVSFETQKWPIICYLVVLKIVNYLLRFIRDFVTALDKDRGGSPKMVKKRFSSNWT